MRAAFHNLGCRVNAYETEAMLEGLRRDGYEIVPFAEQADVYVVNTCTVTHIADRKSRQMLRRAREMNPAAVVVAVGCYVEDAGEELLKDGTVDLLLGNHAKSRLSEALREHMRGTGRSVYRDPINAVKEYEPLFITETEGRTRAFVKIQDGCNEFCSYCMIPYVRGRVRSRKVDEVLREIEALSAAGYQEVILTGIHISSYGTDFTGIETTAGGSRSSVRGTNRSLLELTGRVAAVPGIRRVRFGSLEPGIMTEEFVSGLASLPQICPGFHLSLQSGCDTTLSRMRRKYSCAEFAEICERLRRAFPDPALTTDLIVGFPGETEEEFAETERFVRSIHFAKTHVFKYSKRAGTKAAAMPDQVPEEKKKERSDILLALDRESRRSYASAFLGRETEVLFEEYREVNGVPGSCGHSREGLDAVFAGHGDLSGQIRTLRVEEVRPDGTLVLY